jgi:tRNA threonylcarbamoyladenosine biosynthesis protein TsaE
VTTDCTFLTTSPEQTAALGRLIGATLPPGTLLALEGPLGAGKTHFVKGVALGLGVPREEPVVSPTFVLVREYEGDATLYHIDAYRLGDAEELRDLGLDEMLADPRGVVALEWADRTPEALPESTIRLAFEHVAPSERRIRVAAHDPALVDRWRRAVAEQLPELVAGG